MYHSGVYVFGVIFLMLQALIMSNCEILFSGSGKQILLMNTPAVLMVTVVYDHILSRMNKRDKYAMRL
jgi:hypothetical protein